MPAAFTVRPVAPDDFAEWLPLWAGYQRFYKREIGRDISDEVTRMTWGRFFDSYEPVHALVADGGDGTLLGIAHYIFHRNTAMIAPICYLADLFTAEAARGKGVGRALIEGVCEKARAAGSPRVYWNTQEVNATARALYDKVAQNAGFIQYRKAL